MARNFAKNKTIVKFKFLRPGGFAISGHGNFNPELVPVLDTNAPPNFGNVWVIGYDFDKEYTIEMDSEEVSELPEHIRKNADEETRTSFKRKAAEKAAQQHDENNAKRAELQYHESTGLIKVVADSFYDGAEEPTEPPKTRKGKTDPTNPE